VSDEPSQNLYDDKMLPLGDSILDQDTKTALCFELVTNRDGGLCDCVIYTIWRRCLVM
jgi:hypothetical protein